MAPPSKSKTRSKTSSPPSSSTPTAAKRLLLELSQVRSLLKGKSATTGKTTGDSAAAIEDSPIERLEPVDDDDLFHWQAVMTGKGLGGGYENGRWLLDVVVPENYPLSPPVVNFVTKVVASNVKLETGEICLDLLKDAWSPAYTLKTTIEAIHHMLGNPGVDSPLNIEVAALLRGGDAIGAEGLVRFWESEDEGVWKGR